MLAFCVGPIKAPKAKTDASNKTDASSKRVH